MTRRVFIRDLVMAASIGVYPVEHTRQQRVRISIELVVPEEGLDCDGVGRDELARVTDYAALADATRALVSSGHVRLVETLAERIAALCLTDSRVRSTRVRVEKPDAIADVGSVGVEVFRRRAANHPTLHQGRTRMSKKRANILIS